MDKNKRDRITGIGDSGEFSGAYTEIRSNGDVLGWICNTCGYFNEQGNIICGNPGCTSRLVDVLATNVVDKREFEIRDKAIELAIKYYEGKDIVPLTVFSDTLDRIYLFLKDGKTKS